MSTTDLPEGYDATDRGVLDALTRVPPHSAEVQKAIDDHTDALRHEFKRLQSAGVRGAGEVARCELHQISPTVIAHDKRIALEKSNPLLALAYLVEAVADHRTYGGQDAFSKLAGLGTNARRLLRQAGHLEVAYDLYPPVSGHSKG